MATFAPEEQIDFLLKKIVNSKAKGGTSDSTAPSAETKFTHLSTLAKYIWKDNLPTSAPSTNTAPVTVFKLDGAGSNAADSSQTPLELTGVSAAGSMTNNTGFYRQWAALDGNGDPMENWIGGLGGNATWFVRVFIGPTGWGGESANVGTEAQVDAGTKEVFEVLENASGRFWFFDFDAGTLYWANENGESTGGSNELGESVNWSALDDATYKVYLVGWQYTGAFGVGGDGISLGSDFDGFADLSANVLEFDDQGANKVLAAPSNGSTGAVSFRALVAADIPTLNQNTTGTADFVTVTDSTADTAFPVTFHDESNALLDDTGSFTYNPTGSVVTATTFSGALTGNVTGNVTGDVTGNLTGDVTGNISGNAATVTTNANLTGAITSVGNATSLGSFTVSDLSGALSDATLSGNNSGDQTITLTGDVTGTGTSSFAATIADDAVTYAKMQDLSTGNRLLGGTTAGTITEVQVATDMIADDAVTAAKLADAINTSISNNASAASAAQTTANAALPKSGGTMTGNIVFNGAQPKGNAGLVPAAGTAGHFLKHDGTFGAVAYTNVSGTPSLGTISAQDADSVTITGGTINGTSIAGSTGAFTTITASSNVTITGNLTVAGDFISQEATIVTFRDSFLDLNVSGTLNDNYVTNSGFRFGRSTSGVADTLDEMATFTYYPAGDVAGEDYTDGSTVFSDFGAFRFTRHRDSSTGLVANADNVLSLKFNKQDACTQADQTDGATTMADADEANATVDRSLGAVAKARITITNTAENGDAGTSPNTNYAPDTAATNGYPIRHNLATQSVYVIAIKDPAGTPTPVYCKYAPIDNAHVRVTVGKTSEGEVYDIIVIG